MKLMRGVALVSAFFLSSVVFAQGTGSITGAVRDNTGAVVPGAEVALTSQAQGTTLTTVTNAAGEYLFAALPAGTYNLAVTASGFNRFELKDIVLDVAQKSRLDATLTVGNVKQAVTVESVATQVETDSSELSGVVTGKEMSQLVLNGRNFTQLVTLTPGVSNQTGQDEGTVGVYGNVSFSMNGGRVEYNNWEVDGGDNMDNGSNDTLNVYPSIDAIAEFRVLTSNYGAQYGRNGSGTVETITKSGTTAFHGDLYEFFRNEDLNANNYFDNSGGVPRPEYRKNDYGYTLGGPVFIPKLYNRDKNKTFFFWSEEWRKDSVPGQTFNQPVPSNAERAGNFSDVCPAYNGGNPSVNTTNFPDCPVMPGSVSNNIGTAFPNNTVPVNSNALTIENALIPQGNGVASGLPTYLASPITPTNWREELFRIDENLNDNNRLFVRFIHDSWNTVTPTTLWSTSTSSFPTVETSFVGPGVSLVAHLTDNLSPSLLNEFTFSYTTDHIFLNAVGDVARPSSMTMTGIFNNGFNGLLPAVAFCCNAAYGGGTWGEDPGYFPWNNANPTYTYRDQIAKIAGPHNMFIGFYFAARQKNEMSSGADQEGILTFSSTAPISTGNAFADFLMGQIGSFEQWNTALKYYNREKSMEPYFQDDWHVSKRLTLNLGVRLSMFGTYYERYQHANNFEPGVYSAANAPQIDVTGSITGVAGDLVPGVGTSFDGIVTCGKNGAPPGCQKGHLFNPAPRVGFSYDPFGDGKTAIRGGYGIFYEITNGNEANTESLENSPPTILSPTQYNIVGYTNIGGGGGLLPPLNVTSIATEATWPYVQQWHFDVQRQLAHDSVLTVAYVGSKGTHLTDQLDLNQLFPTPASQNPYAPGEIITANDCNSLTNIGTPQVTGTVNGKTITGQPAINLQTACGNNANPYRPYYGFGSITGLELGANSNYNALQVSAQHCAGKLQLNLAYTWSHSLDDSSDRGDSSFVNSYNLEQTYASSNFDQRHLLNFSWVYDLPLFQHGLLHSVLGGWEYSGILTFQTGTPFSVLYGGYPDNAGVGNSIGSGSYVDVVGNPNSNVPSTPNGGPPVQYNPAAFAAPTGLTFGNAGRNILTNPSRTNFDMGLFKQFHVTESKYFEFRAEAYNVFNHTQWLNLGGPNNVDNDPITCVALTATNTCANDGTFLVPNGAHNPRIMQLALKLIF